MFHYKITVSRDGKFLFSTEWENDRDRALRAYLTLQRRLPENAGFAVRVTQDDFARNDATSEFQALAGESGQ